ncbi:hypothetical protein L9F63_023481, partial [Diploptera punctata]
PPNKSALLPNMSSNCRFFNFSIFNISYVKYDVIIGKGTLQITTTEQNKTNHCSRAAWRVDFYGLAFNASTILFVVSASVLMRGLPGGLIFCILPVSSSRFLHFPTVHGCNVINS